MESPATEIDGLPGPLVDDLAMSGPVMDGSAIVESAMKEALVNGAAVDGPVVDGAVVKPTGRNPLCREGSSSC